MIPDKRAANQVALFTFLSGSSHHYLQSYLFKRFPKIHYLCYMYLLDANRKQLFQLCETHKVKELYLFGSALTSDFKDSSDIDLLIQFYQVDLMEYFDNYMDLKEKLEQLFNRRVDLVENQAIRNPIFRKVIDREKQLVYERKDS